jgi:hypothetical protein
LHLLIVVTGWSNIAMAAVSWRDGVQELRRLVAAEGSDPDRIQDVSLTWRAFQAFLTVPLDGLFDRWEGEDVEADTLVIEFPVCDWPDGQPGLLLARRFAVPATPWHDGVPGDPSTEDSDSDFDLADAVQIQVTLTFPPDTTGEIDEFWTAARSGEFEPSDLAEAKDLITELRFGQPTHSTIELMPCN